MEFTPAASLTQAWLRGCLRNLYAIYALEDESNFEDESSADVVDAINALVHYRAKFNARYGIDT